MQIRLIQLADAARMIELNRALDTETDFMLMEPGERITTLEQQVSRIKAISESGVETLFVAQDDLDLVGLLLLPREQHCAAGTRLGS